LGEEIELRCLRVDAGEEGNDVTWPDQAEVRVNGSKLTEFYPSTSLRRRKDVPLVITQAVFKISECDIEDCGVTEIVLAIDPAQISTPVPPITPPTPPPKSSKQPKKRSRNSVNSTPTAPPPPPPKRLPPNSNGVFLLGIYHTSKYSIKTLYELITTNLPTCGIEYMQALMA
jgi:hypothetical protein